MEASTPAMNIKGENGGIGIKGTRCCIKQENGKDGAMRCRIKQENDKDGAMSFIKEDNGGIEKTASPAIMASPATMASPSTTASFDAPATTAMRSIKQEDDEENNGIDTKAFKEDNGGVGMKAIKQEDSEEKIDNGGINVQAMLCDEQEHSDESNYEIGNNVKMEEEDQTTDSIPASSKIIENSRIKVEEIEDMVACDEVGMPSPPTSPHNVSKKEEEQRVMDGILMPSPVYSGSTQQQNNVNNDEVEERRNLMPLFPIKKEVKTENFIETVKAQPIMALKDPPIEVVKEVLPSMTSFKVHCSPTEPKGSRKLTKNLDWINDMESFLMHVPHGRKSAVCSKTNAVSVIRQVKKLASGKGVDYKHWKRVPQKFGEGETINLFTTNFDELYERADKWELKYGKDKGHGWLLKHPIMKLKLFQAYWRKQEKKMQEAATGFITSKL